MLTSTTLSLTKRCASERTVHPCPLGGNLTLYNRFINHAYQLAKAWGEDCMIWMVPAKGEPIRWCRSTTVTDAIADLVFGC